MTLRSLVCSNLLIALIVGATSCALKPQSITNHKWNLEEHDSILKDSLTLNRIKFVFKRQNFKTLQFERDQKFSYDYQNFPFYNWSTNIICGTDELELNQESTLYDVRGDTLRLKFKGTEFGTQDCCNYDRDKEYLISSTSRKTITLSLIRDLKKQQNGNDKKRN